MTQENEDNLQFLRFIELKSIDSTNNYALDMAKMQNLTERQVDKLHGTSVFAHEQHQGKGQRGKSWTSAPGENVQTSLIIAPAPLKLHQQFVLSAMIALIVREVMSQKSGEEFTIKWPNDIYFQDRKAGGILIENIVSGTDWRWAIAGIGLNINQTEFDPHLPNPVSLKEITGKSYDCVALAKEIGRKAFGAFEEFFPNGNVAPIRFADRRRHDEIAGETSSLVFFDGTETKEISRIILAEYNNHLYKRGEKVKLRKDSRVFEATIKEVTASGQLVVEHALEERFNFGEVVWLF